MLLLVAKLFWVRGRTRFVKVLTWNCQSCYILLYVVIYPLPLNALGLLCLWRYYSFWSNNYSTLRGKVRGCKWALRGARQPLWPPPDLPIPLLLSVFSNPCSLVETSSEKNEVRQNYCIAIMNSDKLDLLSWAVILRGPRTDGIFSFFAKSNFLILDKLGKYWTIFMATLPEQNIGNKKNRKNCN